MAKSSNDSVWAYQPMHVFTAVDADAGQAEVMQAIDALNARVMPLAPSKQFSEQYLELIAKAKDAANSGNWSEAQNVIWQSAFLVNRAIETRNKRPLVIKLAFAPFLTFGLLMLFDWLARMLLHFPILLSVLRPEYFQYLWTGAIGGTTIAYWGLVKHTILLDFDDEYEMWYWFKPLLGAIFGLVSVIIVEAGFISLQGDVQLAASNKLPLHIIAFLAGFSERFFVQLIDRVVTALFGGAAPAQPAPVPPPQPVKVIEAGAAQPHSTEEEGSGKESEHPGLP